MRIKEAFHFPEWYGQNWSAFWDLLNEPRDYTLVKIKGLNSLPDELKPSGDMVISLLKENKKDYEQFMQTHPQFDYRFEHQIID